MTRNIHRTLTREEIELANRPPACCGHCGATPLTNFTMSRFSTKYICVHCEALEKRHPLYIEAKAIELAAVKAKNMNYPGIGTPPDLIEASRLARTQRETGDADGAS